MSRRLLLVLGLCTCASACESNATSALIVSDLVVLAPLPGQDVSVAYMTLRNNSNQAITIESFKSPQFSNIAMHETTTNNNISRMRPLKTLTIDAYSQVSFMPGGKHLMLEDPVALPEHGMSVILKISYDNNDLATISSEMRAR